MISSRLLFRFKLAYWTLLLLIIEITVARAVSAQKASISDTNTAICPANLASEIQKVTSRPLLAKARWGIAVETLAGGKTLYNQERDKYFIPASNVKLLTSAAALTRLGADFRIRTSIYATERKSLLLVGRGDPTLTNPQLRALVAQLQPKYSQIDKLTLSDRYFQGTTLHPTWEWEDVQYYYGTTVNSLILNQNAVGLTLSPQSVGTPLKYAWSDPVAGWGRPILNESITAAANSPANILLDQIPGKAFLKIKGQLPAGGTPDIESLAVIDPAKYFSDSFQIALLSAGIKVKDLEISPTAEIPNSAAEVAFIESPPLSDLVIEVNQNSNNLYAEVLLRTLGAAKPIEADENAAVAGLSTLKATLEQIGVDSKTYAIADGSGLSRHNLVSPESLIQTLKAMDKSPYAKLYRQSLPASGVGGTLKNRFGNAVNLIQAKTGTMTGVVALSGYINPKDYEQLVFSIIVNQSDQKAIATRQAVDEVVVLLTKLRKC